MCEASGASPAVFCGRPARLFAYGWRCDTCRVPPRTGELDADRRWRARRLKVVT